MGVSTMRPFSLVLGRQLSKHRESLTIGHAHLVNALLIVFDFDVLVLDSLATKWQLGDFRIQFEHIARKSHRICELE